MLRTKALESFDYSEAQVFLIRPEGAVEETSFSKLTEQITSLYGELGSLCLVASYVTPEDLECSIKRGRVNRQDIGSPIPLDKRNPSSWMRQIHLLGDRCHDAMLSLVFRYRNSDGEADVAVMTDLYSAQA